MSGIGHCEALDTSRALGFAWCDSAPGSQGGCMTDLRHSVFWPSWISYEQGDTFLGQFFGLIGEFNTCLPDANNGKSRNYSHWVVSLLGVRMESISRNKERKILSHCCLNPRPSSAWNIAHGLFSYTYLSIPFPTPPPLRLLLYEWVKLVSILRDFTYPLWS